MNLSGPQHSPDSSFYHYVWGQISAIIPRFGLEETRAQVLRAYARICSASLAYPLNQKPPGFSRINDDGTPFQFAVTLGKRTPALRFLSEVAPVEAGSERIRLSRDCIHDVARIVGASPTLSSVSNLVDELAPTADPELVADHAGAFWIGAGFSANHNPQLTIYINAKWGSLPRAWKRLQRFASYFGSEQRWAELEAALVTEMEPLGMALTLAKGGSIGGRIYLSAYGKRMSWYEEVAHSLAGDVFRRELRRYAEFVLGKDLFYPTPTAVCSFGLGPGGSVDFKFEMCGHCIFPNDVEAAGRLGAWLDSVPLDRTPYNELLNVLSEGCLNSSAPVLHGYMGVGLEQDDLYATVYLKPNGRRRDGA